MNIHSRQAELDIRNFSCVLEKINTDKTLFSLKIHSERVCHCDWKIKDDIFTIDQVWDQNGRILAKKRAKATKEVALSRKYGQYGFVGQLISAWIELY